MRIQWRRAWAQIRVQYPVLPFLVAVLIGQVLGGYAVVLLRKYNEIGSCWWMAVASVVCVLCWSGMAKTGVMVGVATVTLLSPPLPTVPEDVESVVGVVDQEPRYPAPGLIAFSLHILGTPSATEGWVVERGLTGRKFLYQAAYLPWRNVFGIRVGQVVVARGDCRSIEPDFILSSRVSQQWRMGASATCRLHWLAPAGIVSGNWRTTLRQRLLSRLRSNRIGEPLELVLSMALGERDRLSQTRHNLFKQAGLAHLLVVSGLQVTLVYYLLFGGLGIIRRMVSYMGWRVEGGIWPQLVAVVGAILYVELVGFQGSSARAAIAVIVLLFIRIFERGKGLWQSLLLALLTLSLLWPLCFVDPGVQLTFAALFGLGLGASLGGSLWRRYLQISLGATLVANSVVAVWFPQVSIVGLIANPVLSPLFTFLGCQVGLVAAGLEVVGIDRSGAILRLVEAVLGLAGFRMLELFADLIPVWELSGFFQRSLAVFCFLSPVLVASSWRWWQWLLEYNFVHFNTDQVADNSPVDW